MDQEIRRIIIKSRCPIGSFLIEKKQTFNIIQKNRNKTQNYNMEKSELHLELEREIQSRKESIQKLGGSLSIFFCFSAIFFSFHYGSIVIYEYDVFDYYVYIVLAIIFVFLTVFMHKRRNFSGTIKNIKDTEIIRLIKRKIFHLDMELVHFIMDERYKNTSQDMEDYKKDLKTQKKELEALKESLKTK